MTNQRGESLDDVLDAFAAEADPRAALARYLKAYPDHALDLVDFARDLRLWGSAEDDLALTSADEEAIQVAWRTHQEAAPTDPFVGLPVGRMRDLASGLGVPRQVLTALRERKVLLDSVPRRFLAQLAVEVGRSVAALHVALSQPTAPLARSYKAQTRPADQPAVTFERVLLDAGVSEDRRRALLDDEDDSR